MPGEPTSATGVVQPTLWPNPASALVHYDANGGLTITSVFAITANRTTTTGGAVGGAGFLENFHLDKIGDTWPGELLPSTPSS